MYLITYTRSAQGKHRSWMSQTRWEKSKQKQYLAVNSSAAHSHSPVPCSAPTPRTFPPDSSFSLFLFVVLYSELLLTHIVFTFFLPVRSSIICFWYLHSLICSIYDLVSYNSSPFTYGGGTSYYCYSFAQQIMSQVTSQSLDQVLLCIKVTLSPQGSHYSRSWALGILKSGRKYKTYKVEKDRF